MLIEDNGKVIMTDPGAWTTAQNEVTGIDIVLITHEHADHFYIDSLKTVLANNPQAIVVTNSRVGGLLAEHSITSVTLEHEQRSMFEGIEVAGFGKEHKNIYPTVQNVMNTGFLIQNRFFYPGDAFTVPDAPVEILAMPIIGPWMTLAQAIDYAKEIQPHVCIPVHDGMLSPREWIYTLPARLLPEVGIMFDPLELGKKKEY